MAVLKFDPLIVTKIWNTKVLVFIHELYKQYLQTNFIIHRNGHVTSGRNRFVLAFQSGQHMIPVNDDGMEW
jgi:hypothetical protein